MLSEGRRAFLKGRRPAASPWEHFCNRLRKGVVGELLPLEVGPDRQAARLTARHATDVHHARRLCQEYGVCMALDGVPGTSSHSEPVLWVRPGRELAAFSRLEAGGSRWFVQPGCLLGELEAAGVRGFADMPAHLTVAAWLADRSLCNWPTGQTAASGIVHASALLADGVSVSLGAFGTDNRKALDHLRLQTLIPSLFALASGPDGLLCSERTAWPARYRLDALAPAGGRTLNLSHLLLGHGGDLAWLEWLVIDEALADPASGADLPLEMPGLDLGYVEREGMSGTVDGDAGGAGPCDNVNLARAAQELDAGVKSLFDPDGLFPHPGQRL